MVHDMPLKHFKMKYTNKAFTIEFRHYGKITVPKGIAITNETAMGVDTDYNFVNEFKWVESAYPDYYNTLIMDMKSYGLNIPAQYVSEQLYLKV